MEAAISADFASSGVQRDKIEEIIQDIEEDYPDINIEIEEPQGVFPVPGGDPLTLIIALHAGIAIIDKAYPKIQRRLSDEGGDVDLLEVDNIAKERLAKNTQMEKSEMNLMKKDRAGGYLCYTYKCTQDGSEHYIEINKNDITDWKYEEQ